MSQPSSTKEKDALWALLAEGGQGKAPTKAVRDALLAVGFIRAGFRGKIKLVEVTDAGWAWADRHLGDEDATAAKPLRPWLRAISAHLRAKGLALGEFFPNPLAPLTPSAVKPPATPRSKASSRGTAAPTLPRRIRDAYLAVTGGRIATRALLADLRAALPEVDRATLDAALETENGKSRPTMRLMPLDDPREITARVRDAQITLRGQPHHLLWVIK